MRVGLGWDIHRLVEGRKLVLGGVEVHNDKGCLGHSDGDVVLHAVTDAILGALALGDIGDHFRDTDPEWKDRNSEVFLEKAVTLAAEKGFRIGNVDIVLVLESPKLYDLKERISENMARILQTGRENVSFKAKTKEGLGETGQGNAVECHAVVLMIETA